MALGAGGLLAACGNGNDEAQGTSDEHASAPSTTAPFFGEHQAGITTLPPTVATMAALDALAPTTDALARGFRSLSDEIRRGALGSGASRASGVDVIVSVGASLFDHRYGLADRLPSELEPMPVLANDRLEPARTHGDVLLTVSGDDVEAADAATRGILDAIGDVFATRWRLDGGNERARPGEHARNAMGFFDPTSNPDPTDEAAMRQFVWVRSRDDEPRWAVGGSYQAVRVIRMLLDEWNATEVRTQEAIIGRDKDTGAPLSGGGVDDVPEHSEDPGGTITPLDAHIRRANPRDSNIEYDSILRRGFSYARGARADGSDDRGLAFVSFQRSLRKGFLAIQARLAGEPLERFTVPEGGGFYFALPGVLDEDDWLGRSLLQPL